MFRSKRPQPGRQCVCVRCCVYCSNQTNQPTCCFHLKNFYLQNFNHGQNGIVHWHLAATTKPCAFLSACSSRQLLLLLLPFFSLAPYEFSVGSVVQSRLPRTDAATCKKNNTHSEPLQASPVIHARYKYYTCFAIPIYIGGQKVKHFKCSRESSCSVVVVVVVVW